ncbi:MAG: hypothetical protein ACHQXG_02740 [Nitrososphaerales archaeon]
MKPWYVCPTCSEQFSRRWNMRQHCRTQHNYDPLPRPYPRPTYPENRKHGKAQELERGSFINGEIRSNLSVPRERFFKMMEERVRLQAMNRRYHIRQDNLDSMRSMEYALNYLLDNFVMVSKRDIQGISGCFCEKCLSFEFQYIMRIGEDSTPWDKHLHNPHMINEANNLQNRLAKEHKLRLQANQSLITLANSLFTGKVRLVVEPVLEATFIANFHGPVIKLDYLTSDHWAWSPIVNKVVGIDETSMNNFIVDMAGSFVLISVQNGSYSGHHLIYIS